MIFLLDSSGSIGPDYYKKAKFFAHELARTFQNRQTSRFGFTIFSSSVRRVVPLCNTLSPAEFSSAILNADYMAEQTFTNLAINSAIGEFADCSRPFTKNLVVITDGISNDPSATLASINYANQQGIRTFAVGVGANTSYAELIALAGGQVERLATVSSYDGLTTLLNPLRQLICYQEGQTGGCEFKSHGVFEEKVEQSLLKLKQLQFTYFSDCEDALNKGFTDSGVYRIKPGNSFRPFKVWCDMESDGGGWIVIQSRFDGLVDFYRNWKDYRNGFGSVDSEHWLGNNFIRHITEKDDYELKIELTGFGQNEFASAKYLHFRIGSEDEKYKLYVSNFILGEGAIIDSLSHHNGNFFSTKDSDNDEWQNSCAVSKQSAWWYRRCYESNLNGVWMSEKRSMATRGQSTNDNENGINWIKAFGVHNYGLKSTEMKLRKRR